MTVEDVEPSAPAERVISRAQFQQAYRHVPLPVAIVLTRGVDDVVRGMTCTSTTSLSAEPPMAMFAVDDKTGFADEIRAAGTFSINYLAADRAQWARAFAASGAALHTLVGVIGTGRSSVPVLSSGTTAVLECRIADALRGGDHWIVTGLIAHARRQADAPALQFLSGGYGRFASLDAPP